MARSILVGGTTFRPRMEPISHTQNKGFMFGHIKLPTIHRHNPYEQHAVRVRFFHEVFINSCLRIFLGLEIDIFSKKHNTSQKNIFLSAKQRHVAHEGCHQQEGHNFRRAHSRLHITWLRSYKVAQPFL